MKKKEKGGGRGEKGKKNRRSNAYLGKTKAKLAEKLDYSIGGGARAPRVTFVSTLVRDCRG